MKGKKMYMRGKLMGLYLYINTKHMLIRAMEKKVCWFNIIMLLIFTYCWKKLATMPCINETISPRNKEEKKTFLCPSFYI